ncbi:unnamed protein product [Lota lota]
MFILLALVVTFKGADGQPEVPPVGPTRVGAEAGGLVTLSVSFSVAEDAVVKWSMGSLPVVTWKLGSDDPADVADAYSDVLRLETDGSLSLVDVPLSYSQNYTVLFTKSGVAEAQAVFVLKVYEHLQNAIITPEPPLAVEGLEVFSLRSSVLRGETVQMNPFWRRFLLYLCTSPETLSFCPAEPRASRCPLLIGCLVVWYILVLSKAF